MITLQLAVPFDAESPRWITVTSPPQLSEVVTEDGSGSGTSEKHSTVTAPGHVTVGGVVSTVVMIWLHVDVLPLPSVAVDDPKRHPVLAGLLPGVGDGLAEPGCPIAELPLVLEDEALTGARRGPAAGEERLLARIEPLLPVDDGVGRFAPGALRARSRLQAPHGRTRRRGSVTRARSPKPEAYSLYRSSRR